MKDDKKTTLKSIWVVELEYEIANLNKKKERERAGIEFWLINIKCQANLFNKIEERVKYILFRFVWMSNKSKTYIY